MDSKFGHAIVTARKKILWGAALLLLLAAGWWWNEHRKVHLTDAVNPAYWLRRWRGEDLYDAQRRILYHGNRALKEVALTIDDGPHEPTGRQILDILKAQGVRATFFVVGRHVEEHPDQVRRMLAEGHEVGNHSQNHYRLDTLEPLQARREINDVDIHFYRVTGRHLHLLRPPGVRYSAETLRIAKELGYVVVSWNCAAGDFENVPPDFIVRRVMRRVENGSIILLHDEHPCTVAALPRLIAALRREGYRFVTISEMLARLPQPVARRH